MRKLSQCLNITTKQHAHPTPPPRSTVDLYLSALRELNPKKPIMSIFFMVFGACNPRSGEKRKSSPTFAQNQVIIRPSTQNCDGIYSQ